MTKRERDEQRRIDAIMRNRMMHLMSMLLDIQVRWEHGFVGGGRDWGQDYPAVELSGRELGMAKIRWHALNKARMDFFEAMDFDRAIKTKGQKFFRDSDNVITNLRLAALRALPENASYTDELKVLTYVVYALLHDLRILEADERPALAALVKAFGAFADWLLPKDSALVMPMNAVYWENRDGVLCCPDWTRGGTLEWAESEQDKYLREREGV